MIDKTGYPSGDNPGYFGTDTTPTSGELDKILTDDFNPWFPGSEYGKDALDEAKQQIKEIILSTLPEYHEQARPLPREEDDGESWSRFYRDSGYNQAIDYIKKALAKKGLL